MADHTLYNGLDHRGPAILSQEQLRRVNQVALSGRLATGMVHDFKHILSVIRDYSELLLADAKEGDAAREKLLQVRKAVDLGSSLAEKLLAFSRGEPHTPVSLDVNRLVKDLQEILGAWFSGRVELRMLLGADVRPVKFDPGQLQLVVMNLVVNARDAMPHGGQLTIKTARASLDEFGDGLPFESTSREYVLVEVADTGCGMSRQCGRASSSRLLPRRQLRGVQDWA